MTGTVTFGMVNTVPTSPASAGTVEAKIEGALRTGASAMGVAGRGLLETLYKVSSAVSESWSSPLSRLAEVATALEHGKAGFAAVDTQLRLSLRNAVAMLPTGAEFMHAPTSGDGAISAAVLIARGVLNLGSAAQALHLLPSTQDMISASFSGFGMFSAAISAVRSAVNLLGGSEHGDKAAVKPEFSSRIAIAA